MSSASSSRMLGGRGGVAACEVAPEIATQQKNKWGSRRDMGQTLWGKGDASVPAGPALP